jgi:hypothetical protein
VTKTRPYEQDGTVNKLAADADERLVLARCWKS